MAKEQFTRSKPHVNVGSSTHVLRDTSGQLVVQASGVEEQNDPQANVIIELAAPASSSPQQAIVAFPIDAQFHYTPAADAPVLSIDWELEILPARIAGADVHVTLALVQDKAYYAPGVGESIDAGQAWLHIADTIVRAEDFTALDGSPDLPDFGQSFHFGFALAADYSAQGLQVEVALDNMQVEITAVPEPGSLLLIGALGSSLLLTRWRPR